MSRLLARKEAAAYCGVSPESFSQWQRKGLVPEPIAGTHRWDRKALDRALDKLSGLATESSPASALDEWLQEQASASHA